MTGTPGPSEPAHEPSSATEAGRSQAGTPRQEARQDEPETWPTGAVAAPPFVRAGPGSSVAPPWPAAGPAQPERVPAPPRRRPRWLRILRVVALVIALPAIALGIGLLVAWIVHEVRGNPPIKGSAPASTAPASPSPSAKASTAPAKPAVTVPADWVTDAQPPAGLTFRHPAGWLRRTATPEVLRIVPASSGSTTPGVEGIGAGFEQSTDPAQAAHVFATRTYGTQPGFVAAAATPVVGQHAGEQQEIVTYRRSGIPVRVVIHTYRAGGRTVLTLGRSLDAQPARAATLQGQIEASLRVTG